MSQTTIFRFAAVAMALGIALGAFGAHGLKSRVPAGDLEIWSTAVLYHLIIAVALIGIAALWPMFEGGMSVWGVRLLMVGVIIFSTSLYLLVLTGPRWLGAITPIGGLCMIAGWIVLACSTVRNLHGM